MPTLNEVARGFIDAVKTQGIKAGEMAKGAIDTASNTSYKIGQKAYNFAMDQSLAPGIPGQVGQAMLRTGKALETAVTPALRTMGGGSGARGLTNAGLAAGALGAAALGTVGVLAANKARKNRMAGQAMSPETTVY